MGGWSVEGDGGTRLRVEPGSVEVVVDGMRAAVGAYVERLPAAIS